MSLADHYRQTVQDQADDWCDLFFELVLDNEAQFDEARLAMAPTQLERTPGERNRFTFHVSKGAGYGCFAGLAESCLAKLDTAGISGTLLLKRTYHSVERNYTQGVAQLH